MQLRDEKLHRCLLAGLCYPAFLFLGLLSTYRAIGRQMARRNTWAKTERLAEEPTEAAPAIGATTARATTAGQTLVAALAPRQAEPSISADRLAQVMSVLNGAR
jgi:hypothetical protein